MGLDSVELVMEVEDEFSIAVPFSWYEQMRTVEDMCRLIASQLTEDGRPVCRTPRAFCTVRRGLTAMGHARENVRTSTRLRDMIGDGSIRTFWRELSRQTGYHLPDLRRPPELVITLAILPVGLIVGSLLGVVAFPFSDWPWLIVLATLVTLPVYTLSAVFLTRPLTVLLPSGCESLGDLVQATLRFNDVVPLETGQHPDPSEIFERVRGIISRTVNIPIKDIHPHSRFIEDLLIN